MYSTRNKLSANKIGPEAKGTNKHIYLQNKKFYLHKLYLNIYFILFCLTNVSYNKKNIWFDLIPLSFYDYYYYKLFNNQRIKVKFNELSFINNKKAIRRSFMWFNFNSCIRKLNSNSKLIYITIKNKRSFSLGFWSYKTLWNSSERTICTSRQKKQQKAIHKRTEQVLSFTFETYLSGLTYKVIKENNWYEDPLFFQYWRIYLIAFLFSRTRTRNKIQRSLLSLSFLFARSFYTTNHSARRTCISFKAYINEPASSTSLSVMINE